MSVVTARRLVVSRLISSARNGLPWSGTLRLIVPSLATVEAGHFRAAEVHWRRAMEALSIRDCSVAVMRTVVAASVPIRSIDSE
jgi:hypothetical protein